jgi:exodeoxyribonuclease X
MRLITSWQHLKYMLGLGTGGHSHGAMTDVEDCLDLLYKCVNLTEGTLPMLMELQSKPRLIKVMPFGKHKGTPLVDIPRSYIIWLLKQDNLDPDLLYSIEYFKLN